MDLPPDTEYMRETIEGFLGLEISAKDMQLKLIASEDARHRLQDEVFHLEDRLRAATRQIEHYKVLLRLGQRKVVKYSKEPKRHPSAFFLFMEEFRKSFEEKNPNHKSICVVAKAGGDKWKTLTEADKAPYVAKGNKLKSEYNNKMQDELCNKPADDDEDEEEEEEDYFE